MLSTTAHYDETIRHCAQVDHDYDEAHADPLTDEWCDARVRWLAETDGWVANARGRLPDAPIVYRAERERLRRG